MKNKKNPILTGRPDKIKTVEKANRAATRKAEWARQGRKRGRRAEFFAKWLLQLKFYRIIACNARLPHGELDIIARRGRLLVFVEVKSRSSIWLAAQAVSPKQWQRIEKAAAQFVAANPRLARHQWRFDVVAAAPFRRPRHIINAWRRDG